MSVADTILDPAKWPSWVIWALIVVAAVIGCVMVRDYLDGRLVFIIGDGAALLI
jgi:hypothetical protein